MTTFLLVRHGQTDAVGRSLTGWTTGCRLNKTGNQQVRTLAQLLSERTMHAIYTSPLERAIETANLIAEPHGLSPVIRDDLGELRFGEWEDHTFDDLANEPNWARFNSSRSLVRPPGGELMIEAQARIVGAIENLVNHHLNETVAVISHLDPLRGLLAHCLGIPLDLMLRFQIDPASVSVLRYFEGIPQIQCVNHTSELPL